MGKSISVPIGKGSLNHNNRIFKTKNVDPELTKNNITFMKQDLSDAYERIFGEALSAYNEKQKRNDRKIPDYLDHIKNSKNGEKPFYEIILQIGDRYDTRIGTEEASKATVVLTEAYQEFVTKNPKLYVFNAVLHLDESKGTPHIHIDFIPYANGYKNGLAIRNSMSRALEQQGYKNEVFEQTLKYGSGKWFEDTRALIAGVMKKYGIEHDDLETNSREQLTVTQYKAQAEIVEKEIEKKTRTDLEEREPTRAQKLTGIKDGEIIVKKQEVTAIKNDNATLRVQSEIQRKTLREFERKKESEIRQLHRKQRSIDSLKEKYSKGTEIAYNQQSIILNKAIYENDKMKREITELTETVEHQKKEIFSLSEKLEKIKEQFNNMATFLASTVQAIGMIKFGDDNPFKIKDLPNMVDKLITAISNYAFVRLRNYGREDLADEVKTNVEISNGIKTELAKIDNRIAEAERALERSTRSIGERTR